jgi:hypothetical protein
MLYYRGTSSDPEAEEKTMYDFMLDELINLVKQGILWFIVTVIFTTKELKQEAFNHLHTGIVRIPGVCYGMNIIRGYRAIGHLYPERCRIVRLDFVWGYLKMALLIACTIGLIMLMAQAVFG